jgi:hypothetical protein
MLVHLRERVEEDKADQNDDGDRADENPFIGLVGPF